MVALIKRIIEIEYNNFNYVAVAGGKGTVKDPYQITIIDRGIEELEVIGGHRGCLYEIETCGALTRKIADELIRHEINNFRLYFVPQG